MSELRLNLITHEWVVIASERAMRPDAYGKKHKEPLPECYVEDCPFCPGHEEQTPGEIMRLPNEGQWRMALS